MTLRERMKRRITKNRSKRFCRTRCLAERVRLLAATPLVLRSAPDRRRFAATPKIAVGDFVTRAFPALALRAPSPKRSGVQNRSRMELMMMPGGFATWGSIRPALHENHERSCVLRGVVNS